MQNAQSGSEATDGAKKEPDADLKECLTKSQKCLEFAQKTGYSLTIGQNLRKYGGPPPDGSERPRNAEIFLGRLPRDLYEDELVPELEKFGKLWEVRVLLDEKGELGRGFAFATFYDASVANNVVRQLTNRPIAGRPGAKWSISLSKPHALVMITNLPKHKTRADLIKDFDGLFEGVLETNIWGIDPEIRPPKLWASLEFGSERAAVGALGKILSHEAQPYDYPMEAYYSTCEDDRNEHTCVIHARNLAEKASEADLNKLFSENFPDSFERARIINKFAFLHFRDHPTADRALQEYYGYDFMGRRLELAWARTKTFVPEPPAPMRVSEESMERLNAPPSRRGGGGGSGGGGVGGGGGGRGRGRNSSDDGGRRRGGGSGNKSSRPAPYPPAGGDRRSGGPAGRTYGERPSFDDRRGPYQEMPAPPYGGAAAAPPYQPRGPFAPQPRPTSAGQYPQRHDPYYPPPQPDGYQDYSNGGGGPRYDQAPMADGYRAPSGYEGSLLPQPGYQQGYQQAAPPAPQQYQQPPGPAPRPPYGYQPEQPAYGGYGGQSQAPPPAQAPQYGGQYGQQDNGYGPPPSQPQYQQGYAQPQQAYAPPQTAYASQQQPAYRPSQSQSSLLNPAYLSQRRGGDSQAQAEPYSQQGNQATTKASGSYAPAATSATASSSRPTSGKGFAARFGQSAPAEQQQINGAPQQQQQQQQQQTANGAYANGWEY